MYHEIRDVYARGKWHKVHIRERKPGGFWSIWPKFFPGANMSTVYIALADTIWCPYGTKSIRDDMYTHEVYHLVQQRFSYVRAFITFWRFYLSKEFRLKSELPAFQAQYAYMRDFQKLSHIDLYQYRHSVADVLSGDLYGKIISKEEAFKRLGETPEAI